MINHSTEYLIIHEDEMDWDALSSIPDDMFSLVEIRLFRKRINWKLYFESHSISCPFTTQMLEMGSKYFTQEVYMILSNFGIATEDFIENHIDDFDFRSVILNCNISEDFLLENAEKWKNIKDIEDIFYRSKFVLLGTPQYSNLRLFLEMEN